MKDYRIKKRPVGKQELSLNKRTIAHLDHRQMGRLQGGGEAPGESLEGEFCVPGDTDNCMQHTTHDVGITPMPGSDTIGN